MNSETSIDISDGYRDAPPPARAFARRFHDCKRQARHALGLGGYFPEVAGRPSPLKHEQELGYAILHDKVSHIGAFPPAEIGDEETERTLIVEAYSAIMESICAEDDELLRRRCEAVAKSRSTALPPAA